MAFAEAPELAGTAPLTWAEANLRHLHAELARLDIAVRRRARAVAGAADARTVDDDRGPEETALTAARRLAEQHRAGLMAAGHRPALDTLASTLALSRFEMDVVLWALAPELGVAIAATPEALASAPHGLEPSPSRCLEGEAAVGEPGWLEARAAFLPDGPLRRFRIIVDEPSPEPPERRPFRLDPRIVCYLLGRDTIDERVTAFLRRAPEAIYARPTPLPAVLQRWGAEPADRGAADWPLVNLCGGAGDGCTALVRALARQAGLEVLMLDVRGLARVPHHRPEALRLVEREALLGQGLVYVDARCLARSSDAAYAAVVDDLLRLEVPLVLAGQDRWPTDRDAVVHTVSAPTRAERRSLWAGALGARSKGLDATIERLASVFEIGADLIERVVREATAGFDPPAGANASAPMDAPDTLGAALWTACRALTRGALHPGIERIEPRQTWDDLVLPPETLAPLRQLGAFVALRGHVLDDWGFGPRSAREGRAVVALFAGETGRGKTTAAEVLAGHLDLDLVRFDLSRASQHPFLEAAEEAVIRTFDAAGPGGAVVLFDHVDALLAAGRLGEGRASGGAAGGPLFSALIERAERYPGLTILAMRRRNFDPACFARINVLIDFPRPTAELRERRWRHAIPVEAPAEPLDFQQLASLEIGEELIRSIGMHAAFMAAAEQQPIGMRHLMEAARQATANLDRRPLASLLGPGRVIRDA